MADADLPVWSFRANWREPMTERLSFLTDVLRAEEGAEQRRSLRSTPRRTFECDLLLSGPERTFFDLFINRLGGGEMMIPLYWDVATLLFAATQAVTDRLEFDTTGHEFAPGLAIISGKTALDYEVVEIVAVDAGGVDLAEAVINPWPKGAKVLPLRRGVIDSSSPVLAHRTGAVGVSTVGFSLTCPNPWEPGVDDAPIYGGRRVFLDEPNWVDGQDHTMDREIFSLDNETGLPYQVDALNRMLLGQSHRWFLPGRAKMATFRDLIYRYRGRAGSFWLPTFKHDLKMAAAITSMSTTLVIENVGFGYTGGPSAGREYIAIKHSGGTILRRIIGYNPGILPNTERLVLDQSLGLALSPGQVRRISFADVARFDQDDFEITHYGGIDALHECQSVFRTFKDSRNPAGAIRFPIPVAAQSGAPCGVGPGICYNQDWVVNVNARVNAGSTAAAMLANGITVEGFNPGQTVQVTLPPGQTYAAWAPWGPPAPANPGTSGASHRFWVIPDSNPALVFQVGGNGIYNGYEAARAAFGSQTFTGYSTYTFGIIDSPTSDNGGGLSIQLDIV